VFSELGLAAGVQVESGWMGGWVGERTESRQGPFNLPSTVYCCHFLGWKCGLGQLLVCRSCCMFASHAMPSIPVCPCLACPFHLEDACPLLLLVCLTGLPPPHLPCPTGGVRP
jgi:hypothetical protein